MARLRLPAAWRRRAAADPAPGVRDDGAGTPGVHGSVAAADPYAFAVAHRRLAWLLRLSVVLNVVLMAGWHAAVVAWSELLPLRRTEIALVRADPSDDRLYRIEPVVGGVAGLDLAMEAAARRFVRNLLAIDGATQTERFREAFKLMDDGFYARFAKERFAAVERAIADGLNRSITVESIDRIETGTEIRKYAVDLVQTDERGGVAVARRKLRAYLSMTARPGEVSEAHKYENPFGFTVLDLVLKQRANS